MTRWIVQLVVAVLVACFAHVAVADDQGRRQGKDQSQPQAEYRHEDGKGKDKGKGNDAAEVNRGQVVSECNHRANSRDLKGHDRQDFVEWCESRVARYGYDYRRYDGEKSCYQKASNKGLTGDKRANFLDKCFAGRRD